MSNRLRIGIVGGGNVYEWHVPTLVRLSDKCEIVAAAELSQARHARMREVAQDADLTIYPDYNEMFDAEKLDVAIILLPHFLHMDATVKAAEHGFHVLTEKVMARNTYECRKMIEACRQHHVILGVAHDRRYSRDWLSMKKLVDDGALGTLRTLKLESLGGIGLYTKTELGASATENWLGSPDRSGGGAIMASLIHQIDGLRFLGGEMQHLTCDNLIIPEVSRTEQASLVIGRMQSGAVARLSTDWILKGFDWKHTMKNPLWYENIEIGGDGGSAYFMHGKGTFYRAADEIDYRLISNYGDLSGHDGMLEAFLNYVLGEPSDFSSFGTDSIKTVEIAEAAYIADAEKRRVDLPLKESTPWEERVYLRS